MWLSSAIGATIIELCYGHEVQDVNDPYLDIARKSAAAAEGLVSGAFLVEFLPFLRHIPTSFPGAEFKRQAAKWKADFDALLYIPFNDARKAMVSSRITLILRCSHLNRRTEVTLLRRLLHKCLISRRRPQELAILVTLM